MRRSAFERGFRELHGHFPGRAVPASYRVVDEAPARPANFGHRTRTLAAEQAVIWAVIAVVGLMAVLFLIALLVAGGIFAWGFVAALFV